VFLRVWSNMFILIKTRGRSSVGRAPALQVDKTKRCALVRFRRWAMSAEARIIRSSASAQNRLRGPTGSYWSTKPSRPALGALGATRTLTLSPEPFPRLVRERSSTAICQ
jgi:hypothetical protein